jgi:endonuclease/exonuclease/phosphatase family metal-dependent hydrolase
MRAIRKWVPAMLAVVLGAASCAHRPAMIVLTVPSPAVCTNVVPAGAGPVTWIAPDDSRDRSRLDAWCRTVGPVLVDGIDTQEGSGGSEAVERLAVVTWNVHVGGGNLEDFVARLRAGEFTGGRPVRHFVLLLQEAFRQSRDVPEVIPPGMPVPHGIVEHPPNGIRRDIGRVAQAANLHLFYAPSMRNYRVAVPEDRGAAILSTLPLSDLRVIELPFERQRRVALAATISGQTSGQERWKVRFAGIHIDTTLALTRGGPFAARKRQAEALIEALADSPQEPTIVGGDFNTWLGPKEPALTAMRAAFPETPHQAGSATWRGPLGARAALDYVFIRGELGSVSTRMLGNRFGSDHHPLLTLIDFASHD